jgi:hypothetical protein
MAPPAGFPSSQAVAGSPAALTPLVQASRGQASKRKTNLDEKVFARVGFVYGQAEIHSSLASGGAGGGGFGGDEPGKCGIVGLFEGEAGDLPLRVAGGRGERGLITSVLGPGLEGGIESLSAGGSEMTGAKLFLVAQVYLGFLATDQPLVLIFP